VVEQTGAVRVIDDGEVRDQPFLDLSEEITSGGEQGLLSLAFSPDYARSGRFYVDFTNLEGDTRVLELRRSGGDPLRADPASARVILRVDQPFSNHNGGLLMFGPDAKLYVGLGDGGSGGDPQRNGQDLSTLLGKILRIEPLPGGGYRVPADNPFVGLAGARPELYIYGVRNPWRFSFDRRTGALLIADVGQSEAEEVDYLPAGEAAAANLGWSAFEGNARANADQAAPGALQPILTYSHDRGCSITGGYVVRDRRLRSLYGRYIYGDYCEGALRSLIPSVSGARDDRALGLEVPALTSFGEDAAGHIYASSQEGPVYRIDPSG
jgi:glucose/arabinose dehydrogenase